MRWFNNLNATPRLMISFGVMMVLTLGVGYLAISNLSKANDRIDSLYHLDLVGADNANAITIDVATAARFVLHAVVHQSEPNIVTEDEREAANTLADLRSNLDEADKHFVNKKGLDQLAIIRKTLPSFEGAVTDVFQSLKAKDLEGAKSKVEAMSEIRQTLRDASDIARQSKQEHAEQQFQENLQAYQSTRNIMLGACVFSLALGLILSFIISRGFSIPLGQAVVALEKVAGGDLTASLDVETKDEVGRMAAALNKAVEKLADTLREVADSAANASSSAQQLAAASETIASGAQEQASSLEETSASLEEITATVRQSADNARQASQLATSSRDSAEHGQEVVSTAVTAMSEINAASAKISDIISTIDEIAFQTNLLAVNAAVEAARAGEEGRGFAVVASEVRSLAQRSAVVAKEIKGLIQDSLRKVEAGSELVNKSGETLQTIVGSVKRVTDIVGEIAAASGEQSTGIEQVNTAMTQMDQVTQANSAQTEELSATAHALSEQSARLLELISAFTLTRGESGSRSRQFSTAHATSTVPAQHVSAPHLDLHQGLSHEAGAAARQPAKTGKANGNGLPKSETRPKAAKTTKPRQPVLAAATATAGGGSASDASFEEF